VMFHYVPRQIQERRQREAEERVRAAAARHMSLGLTYSQPREYDTLSDVTETLRRESVPGRFAYRGQMHRAAPIVSGAGRDAIYFERLLPADFRFYWGQVEKTLTPEEITLMREAGRDTRDRFFTFLSRAVEGGDPRLSWLHPWFAAYGARDRRMDPLTLMKGRLNEPVFRACWSLAQHYGLETGLLDLTRSWRVAAWFATNPLAVTGPVPTSGTGVIYRIDVGGLAYVLELMNAKHRSEMIRSGFPVPVDMFVVDISHIRRSMAGRPRAQKALSLHGFDRPETIQAAQFAGVFEVFLFEHSTPCEDRRCSRETLIPEKDPFLAVVEEFMGR
jgi:hypothetical protein